MGDGRAAPTQSIPLPMQPVACTESGERTKNLNRASVEGSAVTPQRPTMDAVIMRTVIFRKHITITTPAKATLGGGTSWTTHGSNDKVWWEQTAEEREQRYAHYSKCRSE